jgi:hypothetical protein
LTALAQDLHSRGMVTKISRRADGSVRGIPFTKGPLAYLLWNPVYIGEVAYKGKRYAGEHEVAKTLQTRDHLLFAALFPLRWGDSQRILIPQNFKKTWAAN